MLARRIVTIACLAGLLLWSILCVTTFVTDVFGESGDCAIYLLTARSFALGEGYRYLGEPFFVRPPGLPWALSPLAGAPWDHDAINLFIQATAVAAFAGVTLALWRLHGAALGSLAGLLFATNRLCVQLFNNVFAEFGFLALFFGGAALLLPGRGGVPPSRGRQLLGAVLVAGSIYWRSTGLLLLPALVLAGLWPRRIAGVRTASRLSGLLPAALILLLCLPWIVWSSRAAQAAPRPATQLLMFDYATALFHTDPGDPSSPLVDAAGWVQRARDNASAISPLIGDIFLGTDNEPLSALVTLLLAAALVYTWFDRRSLLDWFALGCAVLMLAYFTFVNRLLLPLLPLLLSALLHVFLRLANALWGEERGPPRALAASGALACVLLVVSGTKLGERLSNEEGFPEVTRIHAEIARWLIDNTSPDARAMYEHAPILSVLSGRTTYNWKYLIKRQDADNALAGSPEVDWIVLGPNPTSLDMPVAVVARERRELVVSWAGKRQALRLYRMRDPSR